MQVEITPSSFFKIINQLSVHGIAHEWKTVVRGDGQANRLFTQELVSDDWAGPGVVINHILQSDGTIKLTYYIEVVDATAAPKTDGKCAEETNCRKMLEVSTANIQEITAFHLGNDETTKTSLQNELNKTLAPAKWGDYGFIISICDDFPEALAMRYPELASLLAFAKKKGYEFLKLDRDGPVLKGFETFAW